MLSASRSRLCSLLLAHNGRVARFETSREMMMGSMGLCSGVRVRAFAGARVGQIGVVVGMRNEALWVRWGDETTPLEPISRTALPRMDLRPVDMVTVTGLDPTVYEEGESFVAPLFTSDDITDSTRVTILLDDAATQHIANEAATGKHCERCSEVFDKAQIREAVENLKLEHSFTEVIIRVLGLEMPGEPRLHSKKAIFSYITEQKQREAGSDIGILAATLARRVALFHDLSTVRVFTNEYKLPNAILRPVGSKQSFSKMKWVAGLLPADCIEQNITTTGWRGTVPVTFMSSRDHVKDAAKALVRISQSAAKSDDDTPLNLSNIPDMSAEDAKWLMAALRMGSGRLATASGVTAFVEKSKSDRQDPVDTLVGELTGRKKILELMVEVTLPSGDSLKVPVDAVVTSASEVQVLDEPWCREVVATHKQLNALKALEATQNLEEEVEEDSDYNPPSADTFYGKHGTVTATSYIGKGVSPNEVERQMAVAKGIIYELSLFRGRHMEPNIPEADVFVLEGPYQYLDKACAKELYQGVEDAPVLYDARGRAEYKKNAWHQPFGMVNDRGLERFAPRALTAGRYYRKSAFAPQTSPAPMGR